MDGKPENIFEMVRRALAAQADLGVGELVIRWKEAARPQTAARLIAHGTRTISVAAALGVETVTSEGLAG